MRRDNEIFYPGEREDFMDKNIRPKQVSTMFYVLWKELYINGYIERNNGTNEVSFKPKGKTDLEVAMMLGRMEMVRDLFHLVYRDERGQFYEVDGDEWPTALCYALWRRFGDLDDDAEMIEIKRFFREQYAQKD